MEIQIRETIKYLIYIAYIPYLKMNIQKLTLVNYIFDNQKENDKSTCLNNCVYICIYYLIKQLKLKI